MRSRSKNLGHESIRFRSMFIEAKVLVESSVLGDQAMIALPGPDYADVMVAVHGNAVKLESLH